MADKIQNTFPPIRDAILRTDHLTKRYGSLVAVNDLCLEIYPGEIFGLLGPNGAGKTTTISMICGLLKPDSGQVFLEGSPFEFGDYQARSRIGVCPQSIMLWSKLTCIEQVIFLAEMYNVPTRIARQRGLDLLDVVGLSDRRNNLASTLSGGMQRRLNLVMALVNDPRVLILDEPEAGLDPQSRVMVREYVRSWARSDQRTVILTTHNMDEADRMADRVAIIDHGELLVVDTPEALKHSLGEGDVLEIELSNANESDLKGAQTAADAVFPGIQLLGHSLVFRACGVVDQLTRICDVVKMAGYHTGEVRLRESTLEDVFISLTGRRLRE